MKTKYDWSGVPKEVNWISTDWEGFKLYHTSEPQLNDNIMAFDSGNTDTIGYSHCFEDSEFNGKWQDSLEERPNEFN